MSHAHATLGVSAPHLNYICPAGANVKLLCTQRGAALHPNDVLRTRWLFTQHSDQHCTGQQGPRGIVFSAHSHVNHSVPPGLHFGSTEKNFWMFLENVTYADQGRYCCVIIDLIVDHKHRSPVQRPHSHILLHVTPRKDIKLICMNVQ